MKWTIDKRAGSIVNRASGKVLNLSLDDSSTVLMYSPTVGRNQQWRFKGRFIENRAKRRRLDISGGVGGSRIICYEPHGGENQQWLYDELSSEIVNPASRKVLDVHGEVRLPQDVRRLLDSLGKGVDPVFVRLLEALFKARSDPSEIGLLVGLLASRDSSRGGA